MTISDNTEENCPAAQFYDAFQGAVGCEFYGNPGSALPPSYEAKKPQIAMTKAVHVLPLTSNKSKGIPGAVITIVTEDPKELSTKIRTQKELARIAREAARKVFGTASIQIVWPNKIEEKKHSRPDKSLPVLAHERKPYVPKGIDPDIIDVHSGKFFKFSLPLRV